MVNELKNDLNEKDNGGDLEYGVFISLAIGAVCLLGVFVYDMFIASAA